MKTWAVFSGLYCQYLYQGTPWRTTRVDPSPPMTMIMILLSPTAPCPTKVPFGIKTVIASTSWGNMATTVTVRYVNSFHTFHKISDYSFLVHGKITFSPTLFHLQDICNLKQWEKKTFWEINTFTFIHLSYVDGFICSSVAILSLI